MKGLATGPGLCRAGGAPPRIYGHRGARGLWPENTIEGVEALRRAGFDGVEIDVQNARGVPVLMHDPLMPMQLARDGSGHFIAEPGPPICTMSVAELQRHDIGRLNPASAYAARYPDQRPIDGARVPTFQAFCDWARGAPGMVLNVEIKSFADRTDLGDPPQVLARAVLEPVLAGGLGARVIVSSFDWRVLRAAREIAPQIARGYLSQTTGPGARDDSNIIDGSPWMDGLDRAAHGGTLPGVIAAAGGQVWCPRFTDLTEPDLHAAHALGLAVNVWTVNTPEDARRMAGMGVDGIITDRPDLVRAALGPDAPSGAAA